MNDQNTVFQRTRRTQEEGGLSLAPLIDVVFLLIIFFLVSTTFTTQPGLQVYLPQAGGQVDVPEDQWIITVTEEGGIYLQDDELTPEELRSRLQQEPRPVVVRADERVPHGTLVSVLDRVRQAGINQVSIATRPPGTTPEDEP